MRRNIFIYLAVLALVSSCAYQGTIVEKRFRPLPFSASLGVDAMYNFQLRDSTQQIHSQMVTPDVFASYRAGDYFDDLQAPPARDDKELEGFRLPPGEMGEGPYQPVRVMQMRAPQKAAANVALQTYDRVDTEIKIPRWQTVKIMPRRAPERVVAKIILHAPDPIESGVKIPRPQMVRIAPIQSPETDTVKIAIHSTGHVENGMKIPRWQTVRIVQQSPQPVGVKVAVPAPGHAENEVKILRWQTVRIIQMSPEKAAAKIANPAQRHARSAGKTPASRARIKQSAKIAQHKKATKVASADRKHHRKTVASVN
jgi:hypothetical protein